MPREVNPALPIGFEVIEGQGLAISREQDGFDELNMNTMREIREIARGAQGSVHLVAATHLRRSRGGIRMCQKLPYRMPGQDPRQLPVRWIILQDQDREARLLKTLSTFNHPNIVKYIGSRVEPQSGPHGGAPCIYLEFISGGTLAGKLRERPITAELAKHYIRQLASGLHLLKSLGIVHRDLKPANILITTDNQIKIADFGAATSRSLEPRGEAITPTGTPTYLPPESRRQPVSLEPSSDVWALGLNILEMTLPEMILYPLTGPPLTASIYQNTVARNNWNHTQIGAQIDRAYAQYFSENPSINSDSYNQIKEVVKQALNPDPSRRISPREIERLMS